MSKEEIRARWVKALRSGEYLQTQGQLRDSEGFCCLGVLCDLVQEDISGWWDGEEFLTQDDEEHHTSLPRSVMDLVGIADDEGMFRTRSGGLALMNDGDSSFEQIADLIEKHPEEIFIDEVQS